MKKFFFLQLLAFMAVYAMAVPVKRGQWMTLTLADGSTVQAEATGDEYCHYWRSAAGDAYVQLNGTTFQRANIHELMEAAELQRAEENAHRAARFEKFFGNRFGQTPANQKNLKLRQLSGIHKGLVLLLEFADIHFDPIHTPEFYEKVLNEGANGNPELTERGYGESVKKYFFDQSDSLFSVDFDVMPIVRMPENHDVYTNQARTMVSYAFEELSDSQEYDWSQYDWDGDGEAEMVYMIYAGYGQSSKTEDPTLIWPHQSSFYKFIVGGVTFHTYACSNEIEWNWGRGDRDDGIGGFCHEFAHCLGYPDLYDVCGWCDDLTGMDYWDLMDVGCYCGNGFCPAPFSIFERMTAGWVTPAELEPGKEYSHLRPITDMDGGDVYIMRNPANSNELYAFEPIQNTGWGAGLYGAQGLLVIHIDYDDVAWDQNVANCGRRYPGINTISRYTYIPADGNYETHSVSKIMGDLFPYDDINSVELKWNTADENGNTTCQISLYDIQLNSDNTVSYRTRRMLPDESEAITTVMNDENCDDKGYNLAGQMVGKDSRGIVLRNGKKYLAR